MFLILLTIRWNAIVLVDANDIENTELAKKEKHFLVYDGNSEEVLKNFASLQSNCRYAIIAAVRGETS